MFDALTIWLRQRGAELKARLRELFRRQLRKLVELAFTDMDLMGRLREATAAADFEHRHLRQAAGFKDRLALHRFVLTQLRHTDGLHLEFGVYKGESINRFAALRPDATWHGFDSFVGLPEDWTMGARKGAFGVAGTPPAVRANVRLIAGFFEDTLPAFAAEHRGGTIALLHIDCDLYSATRTIFDNLADMIVPGTIILFDELINYDGWQEGEYKAFMEFVAARKLRYEYLAYNRTGAQVAVRVLERAEPAPASGQTMALSER